MQQVLDYVSRLFGMRPQKRRQVQRYVHVALPETLEARLVPAAVCDLAPTFLQFSSLTLGEPAAVQTSIQNFGPGASKSFQIEYRLSTDPTIDAHDILLKTVTGKRLAAGQTRESEQQIAIPADLPAGKYYLGIIVDSKHRIAEADETNNVLVSGAPASLQIAKFMGKVQFERAKRPVSIIPLNGMNSPIDPAKTTWLVIHGRNESSSSPDLVQLANVLDGYQAEDQVLMLDWTKAAASGALGGSGENFIQPVAAWAATALQNAGFTGKQLNLVGYSWGSYVAEELAEKFGTVNSILSIEAARDYPGGSYNPEALGEVNFAAHAEQSWAFFDAGDIFASATTATTAEEAFLSFGADHFKAVPLVTDILNPPQAGPIANVIPLSRLLTGLPTPNWQAKTYDVTGTLVNQGALFDAVIQTTPDGRHGESLRFFDGEQEHTVTV